jgi:NADPH:quinone reductase-like Zn-dependent oxidoreductase
MQAIQIVAYGNPAEVLKVVDLPDVGPPAAGEVVIEVEASPINPYDLLLIAGGYGYRPRLPAIMGTERVGRVVAVGAGGTISTPVAATFGLDQVGEAITKATESGGKVLFTPNG